MNPSLINRFWTAAAWAAPSVVLHESGDSSAVSLTVAGAAEAYLLAVLAGSAASDRVSATKWCAAHRIEAAGFTTTNQANWTRYSSRLLRKRVDGFVLTADEQLDADFAEAAARWIDAVRAASDVIEANAELSPFDDANWPANPDPGSYRACPKVLA